MIIKPNIFSSTSIHSIQTTRQNGSSLKPYDACNLNVFDNDENTESNLLQLKTSENLPHSPIFMRQTHTNKVVEYKKIPLNHGVTEADACFTRNKNIICSVLTADCLPVLIACKKSSVVAAIHCGWRGLFADIIENTFNQLATNPNDLECWLGPCISYKPYRVDADFRKKFVLKNRDFAHCFYQNKKGGWHADLKKIAHFQLESLGIKTITQSPYCTHDNKALFYSYRRDKTTGRMASLIWIR